MFKEKVHYNDYGYGWHHDSDYNKTVQKTRYELIDHIDKVERKNQMLERSACHAQNSINLRCEEVKKLWEEKKELQAKIDMLVFLCDMLKIDYKAVLAATKEKK
jgi:hypothetical protein